jgi:predicted transcriptional regulator
LSNVKVSTVVEKDAWDDLRQLAAESHQTISGLLTDAIRDYVARRRVRPAVLQHTEASIAENETLGRLLAK